MIGAFRGGDELQGVCAICGAAQAVLETRTQHFAFGDGNEAVELRAEVPVWHCAACDESYTAEGGEEAQHGAVCDHLGRLRPEAIRALRGRFRLSQDQFAELTGIGAASIKRWEKGALIQNEALDNFLRVLEVPGVATSLRPQIQPIKPQFRTPISAALESAAARFELRPSPVLALA